MTWAQLEEMRDGGVDIESLTVSHHDLRHAPKGQDYLGWLHQELEASKQILEDKLAIKVNALAFPYGAYNETVRKVALEAGYQALFTAEGQHLGIGAPADRLGRYAIEPNKPKSFEAALAFPGGGAGAPTELRLAGTRPMNAQRIQDPSPTVQATLAPVQEIDADSLEMRVSGFGPVPARCEPTDKRVSYTFTQRLLPKTYTVILSARVKGQKVEARWDFTVEGVEGPQTKSS
jgi:peptidoglycan/xylan/chitin deacetylase (PgdA/CDA1 family)